MSISRRAFLSAALASLIVPTKTFALGDLSRFRLASLKYAGGDWNTRGAGLRVLSQEVRLRTSVDCITDVLEIELVDPQLFYYPFLVMTGDKRFTPFSERQRFLLKKFIQMGGFLLIDSSGSEEDERTFDTAVREELARVFPTIALERIPTDDVLYRTFYRISYPVGHINAFPYLEGLRIDKRLGIVYSRNDLIGAYARDSFGNWEYDIIPGGEKQREMAFRLGVNMVMFALCLDYKDDQVHLDYLLHKRKWKIR